MAATKLVSSVVLIGVLASAQVLAQEGQRRRGPDRRSGQSEARENSRAEQQAVPRQPETARREQTDRRNEAPRQAEVQRLESQRRVETERAESSRRFESQRQAQRQYDSARRYDGQRYDNNRRYDDRWYGGRAVPRPYYSYRGYGYAPRIIRPSIVTIVPYRPYVYRPSLSLGVFYGSGGAYPYGYTPRGYYDPLPGRYYGGLRITGAPREAQVFADGYYVGIVNDFDGIFQHLNLEAGRHRIEIVLPGFEPVAFDLMVQPGRTITYQAEMYRY